MSWSTAKSPVPGLGVVAAPGWSQLLLYREDPDAKLSDTQSILLTAAAQRSDGNLLPLPGSLRGGAATKVVAALLTRGLVEEQKVEGGAKADPALNTLWRNADDGSGVLLRITPAGLDAIGIGADSAAEAAAGAEPPAAATEGSAAAEAPPRRHRRRVRARRVRAPSRHCSWVC